MVGAVNEMPTICRLCLQERPLVRAHIYPKSVYDAVFVDNRKAIRISLDRSMPFGKAPAGVYDTTILCAECDNSRLNEYDSYAADFLRDRTILTSTEYELGSRIEGINYRLLKLFFLSILWRASVSNRLEFEGVNLGPYESSVREKLLTGQPGASTEFPIACFSLEMENKGAIQFFEPIRISNCRGYRTVFEGKMWICLVSPDSAKLPYGQVFLREDGSMIVPKAREWGTEYLEQLATGVRRHPDFARFSRTSV